MAASSIKPIQPIKKKSAYPFGRWFNRNLRKRGAGYVNYIDATNYLFTFDIDLSVPPEALLANPVSARCIHRIATSIKQLPIDIQHKKNNRWQPVDKWPDINFALFNDNHKGEQQKLLNTIVINMLTYGNAFVQIHRSPRNKASILGFTVLEPANMSAEENITGEITYMLYDSVADKDNKINGMLINRKDMIHVRESPIGLLPGIPLNQAIGVCICVWDMIMKHSGGVLKTPVKSAYMFRTEIAQNELDEETQTKITQGIKEFVKSGALLGNSNNAGVPHLFGDTKLESIEKLNLQDADTYKMLEAMSNLICKYFGLTSAQAGLSDKEATYNNLQQGLLDMYREAIAPRMSAILSEFNAAIFPNGDYRFVADTYELLAGDLTQQANVLNSFFDRGLFCRDEVREKVKMPAIDKEPVYIFDLKVTPPTNEPNPNDDPQPDKDPENEDPRI